MDAFKAAARALAFSDVTSWVVPFSSLRMELRCIPARLASSVCVRPRLTRMVRKMDGASDVVAALCPVERRRFVFLAGDETGLTMQRTLYASERQSTTLPPSISQFLVPLCVLCVSVVNTHMPPARCVLIHHRDTENTKGDGEGTVVAF